LLGQGKPTACISDNVSGLSAFCCLMALCGSTKMTTQLLKAGSGKRKTENIYVDLPGPQFVEQKLMLSSSFRCDEIYNC
jgi:hypothetical protein